MRVSLGEVQQFAARALEHCLRAREPAPSELRSLEQVTIVLVSDHRMSQVHEQFLNLPGPTDVITFHHGDIFVSVETAAANAQRFHSSTEEELHLYIIHGLLHLHGFDDTTPAQARVMERTQQRILRALKDLP